MKSNNQKLHEEAMHLLVAMKRSKPEEKAHETNKGYNQRRKDATAKLTPIIVSIHAAFERGETVNGTSNAEEWCAQHGMMTPARFSQLAHGKSGNESKEIKSLNLKEGDTLRVKKEILSVKQVSITTAHHGGLDDNKHGINETHILIVLVPVAKKQTKPAKQTTKASSVTLHIEEKLSSDNHALCGAKEDFIGDEMIHNMTTAKLATCEKCKAISKERGQKAAQSRKSLKAFRESQAGQELAKEMGTLDAETEAELQKLEAMNKANPIVDDRTPEEIAADRLKSLKKRKTHLLTKSGKAKCHRPIVAGWTDLSDDIEQVDCTHCLRMHKASERAKARAAKIEAECDAADAQAATA